MIMTDDSAYGVFCRSFHGWLVNWEVSGSVLLAVLLELWLVYRMSLDGHEMA